MFENELGQIDVARMNYIDGDVEQLSKFLNQAEILKMRAYPRPETFDTPRPKTPWTFEKSYFYKNPPTSDELIVKCFEFDWKCSKIEKWLEHVSN